MRMHRLAAGVAGVIMLVLAIYATIFNGILVIIVLIASGSIICSANFCTLQFVELTFC